MAQLSTEAAKIPAAAGSEFLEILGLLLDTSPALVGIKDLDGRYVFANRELENLCGVAPGGLLGREDRDFMPPAVAEALAGNAGEVLAQGRSSRTVDDFAVGNTHLSCATARFPYRDEHGKVIGHGFVAVAIRDQGGAAVANDNPQRTIDELRRAVEEMTLRATTDRLTGARNRGAIEESGQHEILRLDRYGHPVSLIFIDIDHFKQVNDSHGHGVGDQVLQGFCDIARQTMRATDLLGRWGGEEFLLLLPNNGLTSARLLAERLREALSSHQFPGVGRVTASFGVAQCQPGEGWADWLVRADAALYRAKSGGRNRVEADLVADSGEDDAEKLDVGFVRLVWRKAYESGHRVIDSQHRELFEQANCLLSALINGYPPDQTRPLIQELMGNVAAHFRYEEGVFRACGFTGANEHAGVHRELMARSVVLAQKYEAGDLHLGELFHFLAYDVVAKHILSEDRRFFPFLPTSPQAA